MICNKCGAQMPDETSFCTRCGAELRSIPYSPLDDVVGFYKMIFSSTKFLLICIFLSISVGASVTSIKGITVNVISILFLIAGWMLYATAKNGNNAGLRSPLSLFRGAVTAQYIIVWVVVGIIGVSTLFLILAPAVFTDAGELIELFEDTKIQELFRFSELSFEIMYVTLIVTFVLIIGAIVTVNILFFRNLKKCAKSFITSLDISQFYLEKIKCIQIWMMIFAVLNGVSFLNCLNEGFFSVISVAASTAMHIVLFSWLGDIRRELNI